MIIVDGIQIKIVYKKVKKVTLRVTSSAQAVLVSPFKVSKDYLISFVSLHIDWLKKTLEKRQLAPLKSLNFLDGDLITIFDKNYVVKIIESDLDDIVLQDGQIRFYLKDKNFDKKRALFKKWEVKTLEKIIKEMTDKWKNLAGLSCSAIVFKEMKSRWGSCNVLTKKIAFSTNLISQPIECVDYVVLHELAHTVCVRHDKNFYELINKYLPSYRQIRKLLIMPTEK